MTPVVAGDAVMIGHADGFGVVMAVNRTRSRALVQLQNRAWAEMSLDVADAGRSALEAFAEPLEGCPGVAQP
jgi:hypothetical protein